MNISNSNCNNHIIDPVKIDDHTTKLVCIKCNIVIGWWMDSYSKEDMQYTEDERELLK
jgi:hypothetical protein